MMLGREKPHINPSIGESKTKRYLGFLFDKVVKIAAYFLVDWIY